MQKLPNSLYLGHASYVCSTVFILVEIKSFDYVAVTDFLKNSMQYCYYTIDNMIQFNYYVFQKVVGLRFLYPVYYIPEVEITPAKHTSPDTIEKCKLISGADYFHLRVF